MIVSLVTISVCILIGFAFLFKKTKNEGEYFAKIRRGYGFFSILYGACRIFFMILVYLPDLFIILDLPTIENGYQFLVLIGYILMDFGLLSILNTIEAYLIKKTKRVFTIICLVILAISIVGLVLILAGFDVMINITDITTYYIAPVLIGLIARMYLYLTIVGIKAIKFKSIIVIIAIGLLGVNAFLDSESMVGSANDWFSSSVILLELFYSIPSILLLSGILLFYKANS